jgi:hypothetical protein
MNFVTNVTHSAKETNRNRPGLINVTIGSLDEPNRTEDVRKRDSGTSTINKKWSINDARNVTHGLMDKLCKRALVLIKHKVGADLAVSDRMVRVLEEWLWRKGITIYTEQYQ